MAPVVLDVWGEVARAPLRLLAETSGDCGPAGGEREGVYTLW